MTPAPFSTGPRATATAELIDTVRRQWALGDVRESVDLGGTYNLNLRLRTTRGHVVARVYRPWVTPERLASVQSVRAALQRAGLSVPANVPAIDGSQWVMIGHRAAEVEQWRPDDGGADSPARNLAAASLLGRLHVALDWITFSQPVVPALVGNALPVDVFDDWLARTVRAVAAAPGSEPARRALAACRDVAAIVAQTRDVPCPALPRHLVHGDYGHGNVRFTGDTPSLVVDFDFLAVRPRIVDLADLAFAPHWMASFGQLGLAPAERDWDAVTGLIRRYDQSGVHPLIHDEIAVLPVAMAMIPLTWIAGSWLQEDVVAAVNLVAPELATAAWLVSQRHDLSRRWTDTR